MNARILCGGCLLIATIAPAPAVVWLYVDKLDASELGGGSIPAGRAIVDVGVSIPATDAWTVGGIHGQTYNGATLVYGWPVIDPYVTFVSRPYLRTDPNRYTNPGILVAGGFCPTAPSATWASDQLNVAFYHSGNPCAQQDGDSGYIVRIAVQYN